MEPHSALSLLLASESEVAVPVGSLSDSNIRIRAKAELHAIQALTIVEFAFHC